MTKKLLVVFAAAGLISMVCFTFMGILGGFPHGWGGPPPWATGDWDGDWRDHGRDQGPEVTRNLPFTGSDRLEVNYPAEITVTQGTQARFTVTGPQYLLDQLTLDDGVLSGPHGRRAHWNRGYHGRLTIDIVSPNTHEFHLAGAEKLTLKDFDQDSLILHAAGAADIEGQGKARRLEAHMAGATHLDLAELPVDDAVVAIAGAGDASIDARNSADVSMSGAGHVQLKSCPPTLHEHKSGFASVDCSGPRPAAPASSAAPAAPTPPAVPAAPPAAPAPKTKV
jgi:hypothetical protein